MKETNNEADQLDSRCIPLMCAQFFGPLQEGEIHQWREALRYPIWKIQQNQWEPLH
jgi:hypothetical protein